MVAVSAASGASSARPGRLFTSRRRRVVIVAEAWILDPIACAGMALGEPRVAVSALNELHRLLIERGFRQSSLDDPIIVQEGQDEKAADTNAAICGAAPAQHLVRFRKASGDEDTGLTKFARTGAARGSW